VRERPLLVAALYLAAANLGALILLPAYAEDPGWYRYTLFLAPLLVYARAAAIDRLPSALGWAGAIGFALLSAHGYSIAVPGWAHSHDDLRPALVRHLEQRSIRHVLTNWTLAAPIQFFSNGRIVCQEDAHERLPESSTEVLLASDAWTVAARPPVAVRTQAESSIESAFEIRPRPPRPGATLFPAYEELDLDRTLFAHLEPWPLLPPGSWKRDWRGWPYRRPLGRFDAIIWLPNRFADLEQRAHAQAAIERLQERGEFATVAHAGEPQILRRSNVSALNR
jgi:hypothetical protein